MTRIASIFASLVLITAVMFGAITAAQAAPPLPSTTPSNSGMVDLPTASGDPNTIAVRTITQAGNTIWAGGIFDEIDDANGNKVADASGLAAFDATTGAMVPGVAPIITLSTGTPEVYGTSLGANGILYFTGAFDAVDGSPRHNVAAIDAQTGALQPFAPNGAAVGNAILATPDAIYVGTGKLLSFQLSGSATPGYTPPTVFIDASLRGHVTIPAFRSIAKLGNTLVSACQCDSLTDANGTRYVKALVEINANTGSQNSWVPLDPVINPTTQTGQQADAWGIDAIIHDEPGTNTPGIYLAAGGSDFAEAFDFSTGAKVWKTDCSGSCQSVTWYQGNLVYGGHFEWTASSSSAPNNACQNNENPNTGCYYTPKLAAMSATTGAVLLNASGQPWNPGICCRYEGVWAVVTGNDGSTLYVGGEFDDAGGTWTCKTFVASCLSFKVLQKNYAVFAGTPSLNQTLTVATAGSGSGTVTDPSGAINCGLSCTNDFATGASVTLTATPQSGFTFTGWTSADPGVSCPGTGTCTVTMSQARAVTATFAPISYQLSLSKAGAGTGTVTSAPAGINCNAACPSGSAFFVQNTQVTLTATAGTNSAFSGWSGDCTGTGTCQVTMAQAHSVTATFGTTVHTLTVAKTGTGTGTVTSSPAGITCGGTCGPKNFTAPSVTLTASAAGGSAFNGWSSSDPGFAGFNCIGTAPCTVTMDINRTVSADFEPAKSVSVIVAGNGGGTVTSVPTGITCTTGTCSAGFVSGSNVTFSATPDANSVFTGWTLSGNAACNGTTGTCVLNASGSAAARSVTANFAAAQTLTVAPTGTGSGTITSTAPSSAINCGLSCQANFVTGTVVTLQATADADSSSFTGWSGGGCSGTGTCQVTMSAAQTVTAAFAPLPRQLSVSVTGHGTVSSAPMGSAISCATGNTGTCAATYDDGSNVELDVTPDANWAFTGWGGACDGSDPSCVVSMNGDQSVTAVFSQINRTVSVSFDGNGTGSVTSTPAGIDCPDDNCTSPFQQGATVTLHPVADSGSVFAGWSGDCTNVSGDCALTIDGAKNVVADFEPQYLLTVGTSGSGSVTSDDGVIDCPGGTCFNTYAAGQTVTLTSWAAPGWVFDSWGGDCSGTDPTCVVMMDSVATVTANFAPAQTLSVSITGNGNGSVASSPARISCATGNTGTCVAPFSVNSNVTLTATPVSGSVFTAWSGGDCAGLTTSTCQVTLSGDESVSANFAPMHVLTVQITGGTAGTVSSDTGGISCPGTCSASYQEGTQVTLTAASGLNATFLGWTGGGCDGTTAPCQVTMGTDVNVTATFAPIPQPVNVTVSGGGTVASSPSGISCPGTCSATFNQGSQVTLTATANTGSSFTGWSGDCTGTTNPCQVTVDAAKNVTATFASVPRQLTVNIVGTGSVTSNPVGINCPGTCSAGYANGAAVTLTAAGTGFLGWSGGGCSGTGTCQVTLNADTTVTATFGGVTKTDENNPAVAYNGWVDVADAAANGGFYRMSGVKGDKATWTSPAATSITWVTRTGPDQGKASVTIDGANKGTVDLYSAAPAALNKVYSGLTNKVHTVVIKVLGTKNTASTGLNVRVDAFLVGATTIQESDPTVQYDTWKYTAQTKAYLGAYRSASLATASATVTFTGTAIDWITGTGAGFGKASVSIDGGTPVIVDMYSSGAKWQQTVFSSGPLAAGPHTMVIQLLGTKNASATGTKVMIDAFNLYS
jgi:Divergent InlB B-repeat domain